MHNVDSQYYMMSVEIFHGYNYNFAEMLGAEVSAHAYHNK